MSNKPEQTKQTAKVSATDNLKKLADIFFANKVDESLAEIKKAQDLINKICQEVYSKLAPKCDCFEYTS